MTNEFVFRMIKQLRLVTESADGYIEDGSCLETLTEDIAITRKLLQVWDEEFGYLEQITTDTERVNHG